MRMTMELMSWFLYLLRDPSAVIMVIIKCENGAMEATLSKARLYGVCWFNSSIYPPKPDEHQGFSRKYSTQRKRRTTHRAPIDCIAPRLCQIYI